MCQTDNDQDYIREIITIFVKKNHPPKAGSSSML